MRESFCFVIRTAGERKRRKNVKRKLLWMEHLASIRRRLCWKTSEQKLQAHEAVEICSAWWWWKTNYLSWHLNVCNSFRPRSVARSAMGSRAGDVLIINNFVIQISSWNCGIHNLCCRRKSNQASVGFVNAWELETTAASPPPTSSSMRMFW